MAAIRGAHAEGMNDAKVVLKRLLSLFQYPVRQTTKRPGLAGAAPGLRESVSSLLRALALRGKKNLARNGESNLLLLYGRKKKPHRRENKSPHRGRGH